jgi:hypothetical protein
VLELDAADAARWRRWFGNADFSPLQLLAGGMQGVGGITNALGTLAGGASAKQAGQMEEQAANFQATQLRQNASQAVASSQRQMLDTQLKTQQLVSTSTARSAAGGVNAGAGSAATNVGNIAQRGSYQSMMDLFSGQSKATGMLNEAAGVQYTGQMEALEGEEKQDASYLAAGGTLAGGLGSMFETYGKPAYPSTSGNYGA